jgi:hypothetical protein
MATILVLAHAHDLLPSRDFMVKWFVRPWEAAGHRVLLHEGASGAPAADVVIVHVDRTVVPEAYLEVARGYPVAINLAARDISKRVVSESLVGPYDPWRGPVIVKTNANASGVPERLHVEVARRKGAPAEEGVRFMSERYPVFDSIDAVPTELRLDPGLVVEKFLPERAPQGYASRHWMFFGARELCTRVVGPHPVVKGADVVERSRVEVPEELRAHRARLGLDYGKIDFVVHDGHVVVLDANRTPTLPQKLPPLILDAATEYTRDLARGVDDFLR